MDVLTDEEEYRAQLPVVRMHRGSAIRRPLIVLAVCAVGVVSYLARDFLIPTAAAVVLALMLMPVAKGFERARLPPAPAAAASVTLLAVAFVGLLAVAIPSISSWADQAPYLTYKLERKLEGLRSSLALVKKVSEQVEQAATPPAGPDQEKVVVREKSLLGDIASTTPAVLLQIGYAGVLAFLLLAYRNTYKRQMLRIPSAWSTRVRVARVMRDINDRVGHYLFTLAVIYAGVAVIATMVLALLGLPNAIMWGIVMGLCSFVPFIGPLAAIGAIALVSLLSFDDWWRIAAVPAALAAIHFVESQLVTPVFLSRRCALNTVAVFVSIALLGWMWGAVGAIVAVPLLILISTIAAHLPSLHWLEVMLGDDRPVSERVARKPSLASVTRPPLRTRPVRKRQRRRLATAK